MRQYSCAPQPGGPILIRTSSQIRFLHASSPAMVFGIVSLLGIVGAVALVFALGFGLLYLLWTLLQPPDPPADGSADNA